MPAQDLYIEKDATVNDEIDRLRHAATAALFARRDVIIVASVSCIYGIGSPELYREQMVLFKVGEWIERETLFRQLIAMQYQRNDTILTRGSFRVMGEVLEVFPAYAESAYRINLFGDEIESITHFDPLTGEILDEVDSRLGLAGDPLRHQGGDDRPRRRRDPLRARGAGQGLRGAGQGPRGAPAAPAHRSTTSRCSRSSASATGSRTTRGSSTTAPPARAPHTLIDYFPSDFVVFVDESHQTDAADRRHVRGRPLAQADPGRPRLPAAERDRQPAAQVRRVPRPGRPGRDGLGDAGRVRADRSEPDRRADRPPDRDRRPRGRGSRDQEPDRRPDERGPRIRPSARSAAWSRR